MSLSSLLVAVFFTAAVIIVAFKLGKDQPRRATSTAAASAAVSAASTDRAAKNTTAQNQVRLYATPFDEADDHLETWLSPDSSQAEKRDARQKACWLLSGSLEDQDRVARFKDLFQCAP